ncbi:hypothetical protein [Cryptosporangium phraense]|uniref:hypothetical protein n=1 Tax=Cryptosporangium phraense TaxID=2593070 RepID=UPI0014788CF9|nr:hypothetical protein [Cryptosporangium phraense]
MGSKARRTAFSVAGLAIAGSASLALAAPASASTPAGDDPGYGSAYGYETGGYQNGYGVDHEQSAAVSGTYKKVETTVVNWAAADKKKERAAGQNEGYYEKGQQSGHDPKGHDHDPKGCDKCGSKDHDKDWDNKDHDRDRDRDRDRDWDHDKGHDHDNKWKKDRVKGFHKSYKDCKKAGIQGVRKGWWDSYDCDFTKRGYKGWHKSWDKYGDNDWRCRGVWTLNVRG